MEKMTNISIVNRYGDTVKFIWLKDDKCYFMPIDCVAYTSVHTYNECQDIAAIDPEGLYMISVGSNFMDSDYKVSYIESTGKGFKIFIDK